MDEVERLFKEAERMKPSEALWRRIAAGVRARAPEAAPAARTLPWRMAASVALALGALAALYVATRGPGTGGAPEIAAESAPRGAPAAETAGTAEDALAEALAWHADLGEADAADDALGWEDGALDAGGDLLLEAALGE